MISIKINGLKELMKKFEQSPKIVESVSRERLTEAGKIIVRAEAKEAPIRTGNLRRHIQFKYKPIQVIINPNAKYSKFVHGGTGIYAGKGMIRPKNAKVLAWRDGGKWRFAKAVKGQKANPFVDRAWKNTKSKVKGILDKILKEVTEKL